MPHRDRDQHRGPAAVEADRVLGEAEGPDVGPGPLGQPCERVRRHPLRELVRGRRDVDDAARSWCARRSGGLKVSTRSGGRPGLKSRYRVTTAAVRLPLAKTSTRSGTAVARSTYMSTRPTDACGSSGREPQPERGAAGDPAGRQPAQLVGVGAGQHAMRQLVRQQVGGLRQPDRDVGDARGVLRLVHPADRLVAAVEQVRLAGRAQRRGAPGPLVAPTRPAPCWSPPAAS